VNPTSTTSTSSTSTDGISTVYTTSGDTAPRASSPAPGGSATGSLYTAVA
jgi:hypothetical protein